MPGSSVEASRSRSFCSPSASPCGDRPPTHRRDGRGFQADLRRLERAVGTAPDRAYGAYFTLALPASFINRRFGYKTGVLTGLGVAAVGGLLLFPASKLLAFAPLLGSLFVRPPGCRS
jgi:hypothetical protein